MSTNTTANTKDEYSEFIQGIVKDALEAAHDMEIDPHDALENIIECIHKDALTKLESFRKD